MQIASDFFLAKVGLIFLKYYTIDSLSNLTFKSYLIRGYKAYPFRFGVFQYQEERTVRILNTTTGEYYVLCLHTV